MYITLPSETAPSSSALVKDPNAVVLEPAAAVTAPVKAARRSASALISIEAPSTATSSVFPVFVSAAPAVICPAPENCVNETAVVPTVIGSFVVQTKPLSARVVPSSTNVNAPDISVPESNDVERVRT